MWIAPVDAGTLAELKWITTVFAATPWPIVAVPVDGLGFTPTDGLYRFHEYFDVWPVVLPLGSQ